jgi:adenylate kinase
MMIALDVEKDELIARLLKRGQESGRADDNLETIQNRINVYHNQTSPVMEYYKSKNKFYSVQGIGTIEDITGRIAGLIGKR